MEVIHLEVKSFNTALIKGLSSLLSYFPIVGGKNVTWILLDHKRNIALPGALRALR